jgi:hypothetical protein
MAETGIYFKCYSGPNAHIALTEPDSLAVEDELGRTWICYPVPRHIVENHDMLLDLTELDRMDKKTGEVTDVRLVFCQRPSQLKRKLAEPQPQD